jgi:hypothetical protein
MVVNHLFWPSPVARLTAPRRREFVGSPSQPSLHDRQFSYLNSVNKG